MEASSLQSDIAVALHAASAPAAGPTSFPVSFAKMHLKVGDKIPIETSRNRGENDKRVLAKIIGWFEDRSLIISLPPQFVHAGLVKENEQILLRAFSGNNEFAFLTRVLKIEHSPFTFLLLSFPSIVEAVEVRSSLRHSVNIPATITTDGKASVSGNILDIGMTGARIGTAEPLTDESQVIQLATRFGLHGIPVSLELQVQIRSSRSVSHGQGVMRHEYGMKFQDLQPNDRFVLASLLWYEKHMRQEQAA